MKKVGTRARPNPVPKYVKPNHDPLLIALQTLDNRNLVLPREEGALLRKIGKNLAPDVRKMQKPLLVVIDEGVTILDPLYPDAHGEQAAWHPRSHYLSQILETMERDYIPVRNSQWRTGSFHYGDAHTAGRVFASFGAKTSEFGASKKEWEGLNEAGRLEFLAGHGLSDVTPSEVDLLVRGPNLGLFIVFRDMSRKRALSSALVRRHSQSNIMEGRGFDGVMPSARTLGEIGSGGWFTEVDILDVILFFLRTRRRKSFRRPVVSHCSFCGRLFWKQQWNHRACCDLCRGRARNKEARDGKAHEAARA